MWIDGEGWDREEGLKIPSTLGRSHRLAARGIVAIDLRSFVVSVGRPSHFRLSDQQTSCKDDSL